MPKRSEVPALTPGQALFVLERVIDEGKVSAADIRRHLGEMWTELSAVEKRLAELRAVVEPARHPIRAARKARTKLRKKIAKALSPERRESMRIQGRYLGLLRKMRKGDRDSFRKMAKEKGREQAIAAMEKTLA
jgi:uncharacterized protein (DUF3084 family)